MSKRPTASTALPTPPTVPTLPRPTSHAAPPPARVVPGGPHSARATRATRAHPPVAALPSLPPGYLVAPVGAEFEPRRLVASWDEATGTWVHEGAYRQFADPHSPHPVPARFRTAAEATAWLMAVLAEQNPARGRVGRPRSASSSQAGATRTTEGGGDRRSAAGSTDVPPMPPVAVSPPPAAPVLPGTPHVPPRAPATPARPHPARLLPLASPATPAAAEVAAPATTAPAGGEPPSVRAQRGTAPQRPRRRQSALPDVPDAAGERPLPPPGSRRKSAEATPPAGSPVATVPPRSPHPQLPQMPSGSTAAPRAGAASPPVPPASQPTTGALGRLIAHLPRWGRRTHDEPPVAATQPTLFPDNGRRRGRA